jgi:nucleoside-diphosphate-sugar epimerase
MKHVVFGTGAVGSALICHLAGAGEQVSAVSRSGRGPDGAAVIAGDAGDIEFATEAMRGADVAYQCLNPPYTKWPQQFPPLQASLLAAARVNTTKLVSLENLYMYGLTGGGPLTEDLPHRPAGPKGRVRSAMAHELLEAHARGEVRCAIGRASDFFGPGARVTHMGERVFYPALAGKKAQVMGDPDQPHTFSYVPDVAAGLAMLGAKDAADGRAWHLPNAETLTTRRFIELVYAETGHEPGISAMPRFMVTLVGLFNPTVREIAEVLFEFEEPFVVDSSAFESTFDLRATPLAEAIPATVEWFRGNPK